MSRVPPAEGPLAAVLTAVARITYGDAITESTRVYAHHGRLLPLYARYNRAVERGRRVPRKLLDLAALKAASVVRCEFCLDIGSEMARRSGLTEQQLLRLHDAEASGLFDADELLVIGYARAMSQTPPTVTDEQVGAVRARFGDRGLLELTHLIAWENARARTNSALGLGAGGFSAGRACALPERPAAGAAA